VPAAALSALSPDQTRALLPMRELIDAVGRAFDASPPAAQRLVIRDDGQDWVIMPGLARHGGMLCKILRVGRGDGSSELPTISGVVVVLDADGRPLSLLDGATLTARRTAAAAGFATDLLAAPAASVLALFGVGGLAEAHLEAIAAVRPLSEVRVVGRSPERVARFCTRMAGRGHELAAADRDEALAGADIIVTVTTSSEPVFADADVAPGVHINAMGSYRPERAEVPAATVARARVVVETREGAWHEAGDLIRARAAGLIDEDHVYAELQERGRLAALRAEEPDAVTLFKSVGHVALDLAALEVCLGGLADAPAAAEDGPGAPG
jgi:alanine dehydrogenase